MKTAVAAPAPAARTMNLGQVYIGRPIEQRRHGWMTRIDRVVSVALVTVPQAWEMPRGA